ncbi:MAG: hypothetical protein K2K48_05700 [Anaeroplasmataceae bacterium]|nr:hypothetical protein [Anaeroplasmataceae bacterium]
MKKILLLFPLLLLVLVGCSKAEVNADMYKIKDWVYKQEVKDYKYEILNTYEDYQKNQNHDCLHSYEKDYFESNTLILVYLYEHSSGFKWTIKNSYKSGNTISLEICDESFEVQPMITSSAYCVEVEAKGIKKVEVKRITKE